MRTLIVTLPMLALAACMTPYNDPYGPNGYPPQPYPAPYSEQYPQPYPPYGYPAPAPGDYRASGTEPFWDLTIGRDMTFTDRGTGLSITQPTPQVITGVAGEIYKTPRLEVNITHARCNDGMSDRSYPDTVQVYADGRQYRGCGGAAASDPLAPIPQGDAYPGNPADPGTAGPPLDRTRWVVTAVNGRPTPRQGDYSMEFDNGRLTARLGCNSLSGTYTQSGSSLDAGAITATRMACPDMSWETQGSAVLNQVMEVRLLDPNRVILTSSTGSIALQRR